MIPARFQLYGQKDKRNLLLLSLGQLVHVALYTGAMGALTYIVNAVFLQEKPIAEAAPVLLVLLFLLICREFILYRQKQQLLNMSQDFRQQVRQKLHRQELANPLTADDSSELLTLSCETTETLDDDYQILLPTLISLLTTLPFLLVVFACNDIITAAITLVTLPIAPFLLYLLGSLTKKRSEAAWQSMRNLTQGFHELLQALPMLKIFQQDKAQRSTAQKLIQQFSTATLNVLEQAFLASFVLELITTLAIALIAVTIGLRLLNGELSFATGFFLLLLLPEFYQPLRQSGTAFHTAMNTNTAAAKIAQALTETDHVPHHGHHEKLAVPPAIHIRQMSFTYPKRHTPTWQNLSLTLPAGKITVLTGSSGCGKTTLLMLIAGLYAPTDGGIYLEDQLLHTMHPASQQKLIGYLPQEPHLYQGTLQENLLLFQDAPPERCLQALRLAQLADFYHQLPEGLSTRYGDGGQKLSQGQLKRLGLARLILQNNPVMLLDEPTTGLDEHTEAKIIHTLDVIAKGRTMIISSHHPAVLQLADNVVDLHAYLPREEDVPC